jgi:serine/threonine-protein kinase
LEGVPVGDAARPRGSKPAPTEWGHLHIRERIGLGAFGEVYRAWDSKLDRDVALKLLPEHRSLPDGGAAILEEGRLLARVHHRNVVAIYGADRIDDRVGLWMELIDGETLQQAMKRGRTFSPADAIRIGIELASAISAVHEAGLLHRDVKPQNIMLARDGRVVLMDFGTGHDARRGEPPGLSGTPLYLAPELLAGRPPSISTDIYSVGVVLFYLLTRAHPVHGETLSALYRAHQGRPAPDIRHLRSDVPRALALAIARALDPEPSRRQPTAKVLASELTAIYGGLLVLAMAVGLALGWSDPPTAGAASGSSERGSLPATEGERATGLPPLEHLDTEPGSE